jgi:hypothetical protein
MKTPMTFRHRASVWLPTVLTVFLLLSPMSRVQARHATAKVSSKATKGSKVKLPPPHVDARKPVNPVSEVHNPTAAPVTKVGPHPQPSTAHIEHRPNGVDISRRVDGKPRDLHLPNRDGRAMDIHHGLAGGRRVEVERADHSRIVAERGGRGYVEHPYPFRGREFAHRTYFVNGRAYDRFYSHYQYRPGVFVDVYAPAHYYPVGFYGWAYSPWAAPVPYAWGWAGNPWYGYYGAYFTPYPLYASPSFWLTDYLISQSLAADYQARVADQMAASQPSPAGQTALTPEVKQQIADEVHNQLNLENTAAQDNARNVDFDAQTAGIGRLLADHTVHVFVAGGDLDVLDANGQECGVSQGDVLEYNPARPPTADAAYLVVLAGKGGTECRTGMVVSVPFVELQNMQNYMRETVDAGLADLQAHQGALPAPPVSAAATPANFAVGAPPPDRDAAAQINQQLQDADRAEQETLSTATAAPTPISSPPAAAPVISPGMTIDQVVSMFGQPAKIFDLGTKKIYQYPRQKITFQDGKVSKIE